MHCAGLAGSLTAAAAVSCGNTPEPGARWTPQGCEGSSRPLRKQRRRAISNSSSEPCGGGPGPCSPRFPVVFGCGGGGNRRPPTSPPSRAFCPPHSGPRPLAHARRRRRDVREPGERHGAAARAPGRAALARRRKGGSGARPRLRSSTGRAGRPGPERSPGLLLLSQPQSGSSVSSAAPLLPAAMSSSQEPPQHNNNNNPPAEGTHTEPGLNSECGNVWKRAQMGRGVTGRDCEENPGGRDSLLPFSGPGLAEDGAARAPGANWRRNGCNWFGGGRRRGLWGRGGWRGLRGSGWGQRLTGRVMGGVTHYGDFVPGRGMLGCPQSLGRCGSCWLRGEEGGRGAPQSARGLWGARGRGFAPRLLLTGAAGLRRTGQRNELAPGFGASREEQEQVCSAVKPSLFGGWC